jgi:hypothetical protein
MRRMRSPCGRPATSGRAAKWRADYDLLLARLKARPDKAPLGPGNGGNGG